MIDWINTKDQPVPQDEEVYLGLWKGCFCLVQWDEDQKGYCICIQPAVYEHKCVALDEEASHKIYYWAKLEKPIDY
jgi:hypothetical protein